MGETQGSRPAHAGRSRGGTNEQYLRAATGHPHSTPLPRQRAEGTSQSVEVLSGAGANLPTRLRRVDSFSETTRNAGEPHSGIDRVAGGRKKVGLEISIAGRG